MTHYVARACLFWVGTEIRLLRDRPGEHVVRLWLKMSSTRYADWMIAASCKETMIILPRHWKIPYADVSLVSLLYTLFLAFLFSNSSPTHDNSALVSSFGKRTQEWGRMKKLGTFRNPIAMRRATQVGQVKESENVVCPPPKALYVDIKPLVWHPIHFSNERVALFIVVGFWNIPTSCFFLALALSRQKN